MRKLNNKGFTLIELLAVIVILAIVMGIAANSVINSINNSRKSSLYSAAQNAANTLNTWVTEDAVEISDNKKHLGAVFTTATQVTSPNTWLCLNSSGVEKIVNMAGSATEGTNATPGVNLLSALNISTNDIVIGTSYTAATEAANPTCSAIRYNTTSGAYEMLLVAKNGGKYFVSNSTLNYAYSSASGSNALPTNS
mgnify:CR=1 FL=1